MTAFTNVERAEYGRDVLHDYTMRSGERTTEHSAAFPEETPAQLARMLADLLHYARMTGVDFTACLATAQARHDAERATPDLVAQADNGEGETC